MAYTTPASDGWYRISVTATVTTAAATSMDLAVQLRYTEATDNVIKSFPVTIENVNNYNRTQTNTTGATVSISAVCHVKASTDIKYYTIDENGNALDTSEKIAQYLSDNR